MLKVLVVEDEELIRKGIVLAVDWAALDWERPPTAWRPWTPWSGWTPPWSSPI